MNISPNKRSRRVIVRQSAPGDVTQSIGIAALLGRGGLISIRFEDLEKGQRSVMLLGASVVDYLIDGLIDARTAAFGERDAADVACHVPPSPVDGVHAPGQPWRVGKWVAPLDLSERELRERKRAAGLLAGVLDPRRRRAR